MCFSSSSNEDLFTSWLQLDFLFLEKHLDIIFQKQWVKDIPDHYRLAETIEAQDKQVIFSTMLKHILGLWNFCISPLICLLCNTLKHVKFKYVIFDIYSIIFDWVFRLRKIFDGNEILEEKIQLSEQKEATSKPSKSFKNLSNHKLIWDLLCFHIITFPQKNIYEGIPFCKIW